MVPKFILLILCLLFINTIMAEENVELKTVLEGNSNFTKNLYQVLAKKNAKGNIFFSPISIHAILSLAYQGSGGKTREAFTSVLNVPDTRVAAEGYKAIMDRLNSVEDVTLLIANKVFVKDSYKLQDSFQKVCTNSFASEVQLLDFIKNVESSKIINAWVESKTNNKIKDLISSDDLDESTRLVMVNAVYFKGKWAEPFDKEHTTTEKFYLNDDETVDIQMMHAKKKYFYKVDETLNAKVLEIPYSNGDLSLVIILPNERNGIADLEQKLAQTDLTKVTEGMYRPEVNVALPRFKIEQTIDLKNPLTEMGLGNLFSSSADFSGLIDSTEPLKVSKVVQKAFIEVNEEGAEAAAATGLVMMRMRAMRIPREPELFVADHPFVMVLQIKEKKVSNKANILFSGRVSKF